MNNRGCLLALCCALLVGCAEAKQRVDHGPLDSSPSDIRLEGPRVADMDAQLVDLVDIAFHEPCAGECAGKCKGEDDGCGKPCPVNQCHNGCCKKNKCTKGDLTTSCGTTGESCEDCTYTHECQLGACENYKCVKKPKPAGHKCAGGACRSGSCCKGCWGDNACKGGYNSNYCGTQGITCNPCQTSNPCETASCMTGTCVKKWRPFGWGCPMGKCLHGTCCTGCISSNSCHAGTGHGNCGKGGGPCQACWWNQNCSNGVCQ